jgi:hypothetical protein
MRGLVGDFSTLSLKDLIVYLGNKRASGKLKLERDAVNKKVHIQDGLVTNASSNQPREYLGQFLINLGHLTEDQFNRAYETQQETKVFLGKILSMIGLVSEEVVLSALNLKFRETVLEALTWKTGTFTFEASDREPLVDGLEVQIDLLDLHREGEFRETAWRTLRETFPSGQIRLELVEQNLPEQPAPESFEERLMGLIREGATIDDMVLTLHAPDFSLYQRLYALHCLGAVKVLPAHPPRVPPPEQILRPDEEGPQLVRQARTWLEMGNFRDAEILARKANESTHSVETAALLRQAETALGGKLRRELINGNKVPSLLIPPSKLKSLELTAPEKYLLSRIDGSRNVAAIIRVSPLQELEALKYFQRFLESGLIKLS